MKYIINYTKEGRILGFTKGDTDLNIEVSNAIWFEAQSYNKIIIDGENVRFEKVDWRTDEEIEAEKLAQLNAEARAYLSSTDWYVSRFTETGKEIPEEVKTKRDEARLQIK